MQRLNTPRGCSCLLAEDLLSTSPHCFCGGSVAQQFDQRFGKVFFGGDADGVVRQKIVDDGAEVCVVGAHDDGHAELRRLQRIVSAGGMRLPPTKAAAASE